jgi:DNA-binding response OmpR family regulator
MNKIKILLAEDDVNLGNLLKNYLNAKGFQTTLCTDGNMALEKFSRGRFNLCLLDIMMPELDGMSLASEIRHYEPEIPVIFLSAKDQEKDKIAGFKLGADDYITKPFSMEELICRIEAILRRTTMKHAEQNGTHNIGNYKFEPLKQTMLFNGVTIKLTTKESELLDLLCQQKNDVLERNFALKTIWVDDNYFNARSMDVYITRLRKYLGEDPSVKILNIHGKGYKLIH